MRIISGTAKGLRLAAPPGKSNGIIRPTSDRCREALFSILGARINDARVLDLYAGTGAFGLEALSRGARSVVLVDNSPVALTLLRKNVALLRHSFHSASSAFPGVSIRRGDVRRGIDAILAGAQKIETVFDIIFLDPPYGKNLAQATLVDLDGGSFLAEDGLIVAEERSKVVLSRHFEHLSCTDTRTYGDTGFWLYRQTSSTESS
ncbi:MAG: 16S rRNA (guanine(966)-N(2))-methyltransferase RsmD [Desulfopila sp.]